MYAALPPFSRLVFDGAIRNKRVLHAQTRTLRDSDTLTGVSAALGSVTAEALVVTSPELSLDTHGRILVTRSTDPGWVFLIENAAGIRSGEGLAAGPHRHHHARAGQALHGERPRRLPPHPHRRDLVELDSTEGTIKILRRTHRSDRHALYIYSENDKLPRQAVLAPPKLHVSAGEAHRISEDGKTAPVGSTR